MMTRVEFPMPKCRVGSVDFHDIYDLNKKVARIRNVHRRGMNSLCKGLKAMGIPHRKVGDIAVEFDMSALDQEQRNIVNLRLRHYLKNEYPKIGVLFKQKKKRHGERP